VILLKKYIIASLAYFEKIMVRVKIFNMKPKVITRSKIVLGIAIFLLCYTIVWGSSAQNVYKRLPSDYETLGWAATIAFTEGPTMDTEGTYFSPISRATGFLDYLRMEG